MAQPKIVVWVLLIGCVLFIVAALIGIARGENLNAALLGIGAAFLGLAVVFIALSAGRAKKDRGSDSSPPAA